jgi:hypothetical protein
MALKISIKEADVDKKHHELWAEAEEQYGSKYRVPSEKQFEMSAYTRGMYCLMTWDGKGSPARHLASYSIDEKTIVRLVAEYCGEEISEEDISVTKEKRADKYDALVSYAKENIFRQCTTEELVEVGSFSYQTTLKYLQESPWYKKVKKGLWECRDAKADREAEKS